MSLAAAPCGECGSPCEEPMSCARARSAARARACATGCGSRNIAVPYLLELVDTLNLVKLGAVMPLNALSLDCWRDLVALNLEHELIKSEPPKTE